MGALSDVMSLVRRLSPGERGALAEWLSEELGEKGSVQEPPASYGSAAEIVHPLTIEEFFAFEESSPARHE